MAAPRSLDAIQRAVVRPCLATINPSIWEGLELPKRHWLIDQWILAKGTTYLTGKGSVGKSLIAQQAMTAAAVGKPFLGQPVKRVRAAYITAEDDVEELHRRQSAINDALGITMTDLDGWLHLVSLKGRSAALVSFGVETTILPLFEEIAGMIEVTGIEAMALDNVAHLLAGNENDRYVVSAFIGKCDRLAEMMNGSVLLIGHPNKAGDEFSGSTAWENAVRSRLYMDTASERDGYTDPDSRTLSRSKFNYGPKGEALTFRWHKGAFVCDNELPSDYVAEMAHAAAIVQENDRFLECLDASIAQGRNVSHAVGSNNAPKVFASMPESRGMPKEAFERALNRLLSLGVIEANKPVQKYSNRTVKYGLVRAGYTL
ncbi:MAG: AAA family ATPase [Sphingorhabdus sp.]|uniref:AAA family ATPase n=1 Tax=Sphingorhabdus sp. TaxID=1902408 RepID=UPI0038FCDF87